MKNKFVKSAAILTLSTWVLFSGLPHNISSNSVASAQSETSIEQVLSKLTPEQRQALHQLQVNYGSGLQLSPGTNLDSSENLSVIVEFKNKPAKTAVLEQAAKGNSLSLADAKKQADADHDRFGKDLQSIYKNDLEKNKDFYKIKRSFKNTLNGVAIELPANQVKDLLKSDVVQAVYSNKEVHLDPPVKEDTSAVTKPAERVTFPGVDKLHEEGFTGKGIKVGVIDTGIDYNHPDLTDAYKGYRAQPGLDPKTIDPNLVKGWDFVDNDADPMETTYDDWKKSGVKEIAGEQYYTEHGTHVSGIIAGRGKNNTDLAVTGVAPDADLYVYRVLGPYGSGATDAILGAIDKSISDGMDVINLSLGSSNNDPQDIESLALDNASLSGVTAVVAAGNAGNGMYTLGSPGASALAITVGANDTAQTLATAKGTLHALSGDVPANLQELARGTTDKLEDIKGKNLPIVYVGLGDTTDYTEKDVKGKIVLVDRGTLSLDAKVRNAKNAGAKAVLLADNLSEGFIPVTLGESYAYVSTFSLSMEQGAALKAQLATGTPTFSFDTMGLITTGGNTLASFSSRGPARITYDIKPDVTAPGVSVFSTVPSYMNGPDQIGKYQYAYANLSGTSMATPNVVGVAALLLQANPKLTPSQVKEELMNTADPLTGDYSVFEEGAGQVDPYKAIHTQARIEVIDQTLAKYDKKGNLTSVEDDTGAIRFGSFAPSGQDVTSERPLVFYNDSKEKKTFDVKVQFQTNRRGSLDADPNGVKITTDTTLTVSGNAHKKTNVSITVPKTAALGIYEGYVTYTNHQNTAESYRVPFAIRTVEEGINDAILTPQTFTAPFDYGYNGMVFYTSAILNLKSQMRTVDVILEDGKTGQDVGIIGTIDGLRLNIENVYYYIQNIFNGVYYPATGNTAHPFAYDPDIAKQGLYKMKFVGTNEEGKTFTKEVPFYFDNQEPNFTLKLNNQDLTSDVYRYKANETTLHVTGTIFDKETEEMKNAGLPYTQGSNKIYYKNSLGTGLGGTSPHPITVKPDGTYSVDIPINQTRPMSLTFYGVDAASNRTYWKSKDIYVVKDGQTFAYMQAEKPSSSSADMGQTLKSTLSLNNVTNVKKAVFSFYYHNDEADIDVKPNQSVSDEIDVDVQNEPYSSTIMRTTVTATLKNGQTSGLTGDLSLVDVAFKMKSDVYNMQPVLSPEYLSAASYTDMNDATTNVSFMGTSTIYRNPTYSYAHGGLLAEAFMTANGIGNASFDYTKLGITVKATNQNGKVYNGIVYNGPGGGAFSISNLPFTDDVYQLEVSVPGHFTDHRPFTIGFHDNGKVTHQNLYLFESPAVAGDVNKDDVIDIIDALYIKDHWGTNDRNADINFDGKVDAQDLAFVQENYLMQNPTLDNAPEAKDKYKGITLDKVLKELGIQ
ncbi:S8 family serine peptidase [Bacillus sp. AFS031507]|uniref:S8 family serine peptidase n=1 Tax=Bacillus sp. AFS031507 TaxID=2033496 RepID=UPI000BFB4100|nr:S8 family serine peptidase [Bacillus sp. AFS031507]PGY13038.1 hypothetical protein COE25_07625 [Bacillus sp. AFS031507]